MRVPSYGEVGWHDASGALRIVWTGTLLDAEYDFEPVSTDRRRER